MSTWKNARADTRLNTSRQNGWLYVQWHHGTDSRKDALPEGGWEIEKAKYPGLQLALPSGRVLHGNAKLLDCWVAENLTIATLATRTTWYLGRTGEAREIPSYAPGAWSRFHVLAYVADVERLAVLTLRAAASQALGQQLRLYASSVLTKAQRDVPDLPPSAFWLTIYPGPAESRGEVGNASVITPPLIRLPDPGDEAAVTEWLDANFVGQDLLDRFAQFLPEIERFRGASGLGVEAQVARASGEPAAELGEMVTTSPPVSQFLAEAPTTGNATPELDSFDALPSATKTPAVRQALAQAPARAADATAFWTRVKEHAVDRAQALAIITATAGDWGAALRTLEQAA